MKIVISIPEEFAAQLIRAGQDPSRAALEALALEAYRERRMTGYQLRTLLGIPSRFDLDALLKEHKIEKYTIEDLNTTSRQSANQVETQRLNGPRDSRRRRWSNSLPYSH